MASKSRCHELCRGQCWTRLAKPLDGPIVFKMWVFLECIKKRLTAIQVATSVLPRDVALTRELGKDVLELF